MVKKTLSKKKRKDIHILDSDLKKKNKFKPEF
jgi:hypothetical protein